MPPKAKRRGAKTESKKQATAEQREEPSAHAQTPTEEQTQQKTKKKARWTPVFKKLVIFVLILFIPALLNYAALNKEARVLVPRGGVTFDIGWEQKIFMHCMGQGLPTVVMDAPLGQSSDAWVMVQPLIAKHTRVCVYDRAGLGFSDRAYKNTSAYTGDVSDAAKQRDKTQPSTVERMVDDLHRLVSYASSQPKPLLLVSSDFATFVSRFYAQFFEHEVAGLLLIDPATEFLFDSSQPRQTEERDKNDPLQWEEYWYKKIVPHMWSVHLSGSLGFNRLALMVGLMPPVELPELNQLLSEEVIKRKKYLLCQPKHLSSAFDEYYFINESMAQLKTMFHVKPFPENIPITVATYRDSNNNMPPELTKVWSQGLTRLVRSIHPSCNHITLPGSDYTALYHSPQTVANAVISMVTAWRENARVAA